MKALLEEIGEVPLCAGNRVQLLIDGPDTYGRMLCGIQGAQDYILLETYTFSDDAIGQRSIVKLTSFERYFYMRPMQ